VGRLIDETDNRYGRLLIISRADNRGTYAAWRCICDCGNTSIVRGVELRRGHTRSCGCLYEEHKKDFPILYRKKRLPLGESALSSLIASYKSSARSKGLEYKLTREQFKVLSQQNCYYCGVEPLQYHLPSSKSHGPYFYNGLDRVNNKLGYVIDNIAPACGECNKAKGTMTKTEFLRMISRIYKYSIREEG